MKKLLLPTLVVAIMLVPANAFGCELFYSFLKMFKPTEQVQEYEPPRRRSYEKPQRERSRDNQPSAWKKFQEKSKKPVAEPEEAEVSKINWKFWEPKNRGIEDDPLKIDTDERFTTQPITD